jgi:hypothetical protein
MRCRATEWARFSTFFEKALVRRVNRLIDSEFGWTIPFLHLGFRTLPIGFGQHGIVYVSANSIFYGF